jgi:pimeloyl-ACP methyl ester carboxylesterase
MSHFVLVAGAWHGAWCWERVTPLLDRAGVPWAAPDLPSCGQAATKADLLADTAAVEAVLDGLAGDEPAVLCGHSRGGLVITEAGAHPRVGHLVYLTALLLEPGQGVVEAIGPTTLFENVMRLDDGTAIPRAEAAPGIFYNDCTPEDVAWAVGRVRSQYMGGKGPEPSRQAWRQRPTTYVVCTADQAISADAQRAMAARAGDVVELDAGHSPFVSQPQLLADVLIELSQAVTASG